MRTLVTGGTGFIGNAAVRSLQASGHAIAVLTRGDGGPEGTMTLKGELADPPWSEIAAFDPEVCLHAAWVTEPGVYLESTENRDWLGWSRIFFEGLLARTGVRRIVGLGTCVEYNASDVAALREEAPTGGNPWLYARCKEELRHFLGASAAAAGIGWAWGRIFYPYGPGEDPKRICSSLIRTLDRGEALELKTPDSTKDYIFIDDLGEAIRLVIESDFDGCINLGSGRGVSIRELGRTIARILDRDESLVRDAATRGDDPLARVVADVSRLEALGMTWQTTLEDGLREMVARIGRRP